MRRMPGVAVAAGCAALVLLALACSDSYLYDERRDVDLPVDRAVTLEGNVCTLGTNEVLQPVKIVVAMDASQSMRVTDPDGTRATALIELIENLPQEEEVFLSVMLFAGSTTAYLTKSGLAQFEQIVSYTQADKVRLVQQLLTFTNPDTGQNRDSTDFVKPLADLYALINQDIATSSLNTTGANADARPRYSVIFLSDGHPSNDQDDELIDGDAVRRIRQLKDLAEDVRVNTVHVFNPVQPLSGVCDLSGDAGSGCPMLIVNQDAERLEKMAELGGGDFRDFRNNEPINFLSFRFGQTRRRFEVKDFVVSNRSAPKGSPLDQADTDGDGLLDADELEEGTDPNARDTDTDGFSDGVEVHFRDLGGTFDPAQVPLPDGGNLDPGCPATLRGVDTDCDGLLDCDEQLIGTNATRSDSDADGIPDAVEWQLGSQPSSRDLAEDPDSDGLTTRAELRLHMDPLNTDSADLTNQGYRYFLEKDGPPDENGRQCYRFRVENVLLAPTVADLRDGGTGRGAGYNELYLALSLVPADTPEGRTLVRQYRHTLSRFPVGGIKVPVDGVIRVAPEELVDRCTSNVFAPAP